MRTIDDFIKSPGRSKDLYWHDKHELQEPAFSVKDRIITNRNGVIAGLVDKVAILNADEENWELVSNWEDHPCVSINCLVELDKDFVEKWKNKRYTVVEAKGATQEKISNTIKNKIIEHLSEKELRSGYAIHRYLVENGHYGYYVHGIDDITRHVPGSVVIREKGGPSYLLSVDDDQYFGVELPEHSKSVKAAFTSLIPEEIRRKKWKRQGEWFAVKVRKPKFEEVFCEVENFILPKDEDGSNPHMFSREGWGSSSNSYILHDGTMILRGCIEHDQHKTLDLKDGYYRLYHNLAVRSVSVEGVD